MKPQPAPLTIPVFTRLRTLPTPRKQDGRVTVTDREVEEIRRLAADGWTLKQLCCEFPDISTTHVFDIMHRIKRKGLRDK